MRQQIFDLIPELKTYPRIDSYLATTPLEHLPRLSQYLNVHISVKRDDVSTLAMGGNKVRQLAYYLAPALSAKADTVLITGAVQSNFVRLCAAAAAQFGWHAIVQLEDRVTQTSKEYQQSGNVLLNQLLDAEIHYFAEGENEDAADANLDRLAAQVRDKGKHPYVVHLGMQHPPVGALGYVYCAAECYLQLQEMDVMPDHIVVPSGSGLTHAGFLAGARACGWNVPVHGICVRRGADLQRSRIEKRVREVCAMLDAAELIDQSDIHTDADVLPPGYGNLNPAVVDAMQLAARIEALILDPVYSGRTMAGLISLVERGVITQGQRVMFLHTGGLPALFAYQSELAKAMQ